jgi:hypothetical protein
MLPEAVFLLPTLTRGGVMVPVARFVRAAARFGQESTITPRLKVRHISAAVMVKSEVLLLFSNPILLFSQNSRAEH